MGGLRMKKVLVLLSLCCILTACGGILQSDETIIKEYLSQAEDYEKQEKNELAKMSYAEAIELSKKYMEQRVKKWPIFILSLL
ncbi:hypothetical protein HMPREF9473_04851 [ [Hungatella hathewayi WAL-18680]|uniref:DUF4398 domain-containing protein n=2 Tax=Hungatella hathewayi TaxID=154046 RepID=G5IMX3_9FIRM|nr:hypothetical protein HMPREF9473_04851 [ [Hungatella hathewayi WAL-18680]